ncbi:Rieske 2Fe-2S domain-containing protein [Streptomyces curacoi]|uniref:cholesterol 7-desaturase n=1 Tax=Streptomyces curacoi TaxID=146536 RepID=A0A117P5H6_9ACTN|nr:Rieske 2Fe-2S domain-containing protein [Streptomyces curacoi]KUM73434.1 hypothetical protein AQI70_21965 [Streptomyces curacoi]
MSKELPLPYPDGWAAVAFGSELGTGKVIRTRFMDEDVVLFRTRDGVAQAVTPYCPHLGAHLGYGGRVVGDRVVCPFHGFAFDRTGACVATGYGTRPPRVRLGTWETTEANGLVFVWYSARGVPPQWEVPSALMESFPSVMQCSRLLATHPQDTVENGIDLGHFRYIHGLTDVQEGESFSSDGHQARYALAGVKSFPPGLLLRMEITTRLWGLGLNVVDTYFPQLGVTLRSLVTRTATGPHQVRLRARVSARPDAGGKPFPPTSRRFRSLAALLTAAARPAFTSQLALDVPVWAHKSYIPHPPLVQGDGPINLYRRWARQFYSAAQPVDGVTVERNISLEQ